MGTQAPGIMPHMAVSWKNIIKSSDDRSVHWTQRYEMHIAIYILDDNLPQNSAIAMKYKLFTIPVQIPVILDEK